MLRTVEGGLRIVDEGVGRPVVLLHGFPDRAELWRDVSPHLQAGGLRTLALDLPGFGESPAPAGRAEYGVENVAGQVLGALDALGVSERVDVVGHDWGAVLGWVLCLRHPDRVRRFVALSVGHPRAYINAGLEQKRKGTYMLKWQIPGSPNTGFPKTTFGVCARLCPATPTSSRSSRTYAGLAASRPA